jgi:hypothetical protein
LRDTTLAFLQIELPNGREYTFEYDNYQAYLTKVTLPSGGYIEYAYQGGNESQTLGDDVIAERRAAVR